VFLLGTERCSYKQTRKNEITKAYNTTLMWTENPVGSIKRLPIASQRTTIATREHNANVHQINDNLLTPVQLLLIECINIVTRKLGA
jgi:hypothetical protein